MTAKVSKDLDCTKLPRWRFQRMPDMMVRELIVSRLSPTQTLDVPIRVNIVRSGTVAVVSNPTLVGVFPRAPAHQCCFPCPRIVVILYNTSIFAIVVMMKQSSIVIVHVEARRQRQLTHIGKAGNLFCLFLRSAQCRQQQARQDHDRGDHRNQLNQCETRAPNGSVAPADGRYCSILLMRASAKLPCQCLHMMGYVWRREVDAWTRAKGGS